MRIIAITSPKVIEDDVFLIQRLLKNGNSVCYLRVGKEVVDTTTASEFKLRVTGAVYTHKKKLKILPWGKPMGEINTRQLEDELRQHPLIGNAECYRTSSNRIGIEITQRLPILRVMAANGENYYIDDKAHLMPIPNSAANVAIVTGYVDKAFAAKELYEFGMFLQKHPLWKAQIQQINVTAAKELELVPQVGDHIIFLGKPNNYENKFERLKTFYKRGLNEVGWNKYSRISLEFDNQIICTKKEK